MSCAPGEPCEEGVKRRRALIVLGIMGALFIALSAASFLDSRNQVVPATVSYADYDAVEGKRVFQAWNCMGCRSNSPKRSRSTGTRGSAPNSASMPTTLQRCPGSSNRNTVVSASRSATRPAQISVSRSHWSNCSVPSGSG